MNNNDATTLSPLFFVLAVYTGASLKFWFEGFDAVKMETGPHWGFDSFEGLPPEADGMELECKAWLPGSFSAADQFGVYTFGESARARRSPSRESRAGTHARCCGRWL